MTFAKPHFVSCKLSLYTVYKASVEDSDSFSNLLAISCSIFQTKTENPWLQSSPSHPQGPAWKTRSISSGVIMTRRLASLNTTDFVGFPNTISDFVGDTFCRLEDPLQKQGLHSLNVRIAGAGTASEDAGDRFPVFQPRT